MTEENTTPVATAPDPVAGEGGTSNDTPVRPRTPVVRLVIPIAVGLLLLAAVGFGVRFLLGGNSFVVGDCIVDAPVASDIKVVTCDRDEADFRVIAKIEGVVEREFSDQSCAAYPTWGNALWIGENREDASGVGEVLCLELLN